MVENWFETKETIALEDLRFIFIFLNFNQLRTNLIQGSIVRYIFRVL